MPNITWKLDDAKLKELVKASPDFVDEAVRATAFEVEGIAKSKARWITGAMRASIFTKTSKSTNMAEALAAALGKNPASSPEDPTPGHPEKMHAYIAPGVYYAKFVEFGTKRKAARPFLTPAVEKAAEIMEKHLKRIFGDFK
jgi:HK97 gp10 family phage protein